MEIQEERKEHIIIFDLKGRLDSNTSPSVEKKILKAIEEDSHDVILDFSFLEYLSSAGIRLLVLAHKEIEKQGGRILLASVSKEIENTLYITGFLSYFKFFDNREQAITALLKTRKPTQ